MRPGLCVSSQNMIQLSDIQAALSRIRADIRVSPCPRSETFSGITGNSIYLKLDNQQRTGAFKERGALNKLLTLTPEERSHDETVIAGQGSLGLEILQQHPEIEVIVSPIGGGGLIGGIACAVKETRRSVKVYGVQPARIPSMKAAVAAGKPVTLESAKTIADGIAGRRAGDCTLPLVQKYVDDIVTVEEEEIANAILLLLEREKTLAEGAGAAAIAAVLNQKIPLHNKRVAVLVCGGNIDVTLLARIIERGLVKDGRLVRLRVHLPDYPGALYRLTGILADHRANIVETSYDRAYHGVTLGDTAIDITMETRGPEHIAELLAALGGAGYTHERIL